MPRRLISRPGVGEPFRFRRAGPVWDRPLRFRRAARGQPFGFRRAVPACDHHRAPRSSDLATELPTFAMKQPENGVTGRRSGQLGTAGACVDHRAPPAERPRHRVAHFCDETARKRGHRAQKWATRYSRRAHSPRDATARTHGRIHPATPRRERTAARPHSPLDARARSRGRGHATTVILPPPRAPAPPRTPARSG